MTERILHRIDRLVYFAARHGALMLVLFAALAWNIEPPAMARAGHAVIEASGHSSHDRSVLHDIGAASEHAQIVVALVSKDQSQANPGPAAGVAPVGETGFLHETIRHFDARGSPTL